MPACLSPLPPTQVAEVAGLSVLQLALLAAMYRLEGKSKMVVNFEVCAMGSLLILNTKHFTLNPKP